MMICSSTRVPSTPSLLSRVGKGHSSRPGGVEFGRVGLLGDANMALAATPTSLAIKEDDITSITEDVKHKLEFTGSLQVGFKTRRLPPAF